MSPHHPDSEDGIEQATVERFVSMGYDTANLYHETFRDTEPSPQPFPKGRGKSSRIRITGEGLIFQDCLGGRGN